MNTIMPINAILTFTLCNEHYSNLFIAASKTNMIEYLRQNNFQHRQKGSSIVLVNAHVYDTIEHVSAHALKLCFSALYWLMHQNTFSTNVKSERPSWNAQFTPQGICHVTVFYRFAILLLCFTVMWYRNKILQFQQELILSYLNHRSQFYLQLQTAWHGDYYYLFFH